MPYDKEYFLANYDKPDFDHAKWNRTNMTEQAAGAYQRALDCKEGVAAERFYKDRYLAWVERCTPEERS
jgi:hypothetical protein